VTTEQQINQTTTETPPPQDHHAEQSLLGAMLIDNHYIDNVCAIVNRDDFHEKRHQLIFDAIVSLAERNIAADLVTVTNELVTLANLEAIGGRAYLVELQEDVYSAANCERYAEIVREKALLRRLMRTSTEILSRAQNNEDPKELIEYADRKFFELAAGSGNSEMRSQAEVAKSALAGLDETLQAREHPEIRKRWLRTGLSELDNLLFRLDPGLTTIIAARPGDGKTVLSLQICDWLDRCGIASAFVSHEMPEEQLLMRLVCMKTEIAAWKIRTGDLTDSELARVYTALGEHGSGECRLHITHIRGARTPFEVRRRLRQLKREFDIKLAVIDYVQLMTAPGRKWDKRTDELSFIASFLDETSSELGIHNIVVSQMSRPEKGKPEREPQLEDLRDCGSLEAIANNVMFVHHAYRHNSDKRMHPDGYPDIIMRKQRQGPTGSVRLFFDKERVRFTSLLQEIAI
jgi:replicative DNA helicase